MTTEAPYPDRIADVEQLDELLSRPSVAAVDALVKTPGDLLLLGVAGKMGPSLARMARRASDAAGTKRRIIGVSRFSNPEGRQELERFGVETIQGDLLDRSFLTQLPDAPNVIFMAGMKFGASQQQAATWAMNVYLPALVGERFRQSRIAAFSTGNVYGLVPHDRGGSREQDEPAPVGEYAMSCLGRERMFEYTSRSYSTPTALLRLNYAVEMRYGVLVDLAQQVQAGEPVDVSMGYVNVLWQGDANAMALCALADAATPPFYVNLAGPELLGVREIASEFGRLLGRPVEFVGREATDALLSNGSLAHQRYGLPRVDARQVIRWVAAWVRDGLPTHGKPTRFQVRDGAF